MKEFLRRRAGAAPGGSRHLPPPRPRARAPTFRLLSRAAVTPGESEITANPRAFGEAARSRAHPCAGLERGVRAMLRLGTLFWIGLAIVAGYATIQFKYDVQALERELAQLDAKILRHQEAIHVLKAEWAYLNEPARLERLSRSYLDLSPSAAARSWIWPRSQTAEGEAGLSCRRRTLPTTAAGRPAKKPASLTKTKAVP